MAIKRTEKKSLSSHGSRGRVGGFAAAGTVESDLRPYYFAKLAPCIATCPQGTEVREAINIINLREKHGISLEDAFDRAWEVWTSVNPLPAVLGRVCPHPCEAECNRKKKDGSVSINKIERFLGDRGIARKLALKRSEDYQERLEKIAVIGSGPAGLNCAYHLAKRGYKVKIFEAFSNPGGMLRYGIPAYRLPRDILSAEIQRILDLGVELQTNVTVGKDISFDEVSAEYNAIFVGIGAHKGKSLGIPGEEAENVITGATFLNMLNSGYPPEVGNRVVVVGGGDSAMDAARVCRRLGADVTVVYRRTRHEMPAIEEDIVGAEVEGIHFNFLCTPVELFLEGDKAVRMKCQKMELGEPDSSGRRRPVPIDEFFELDFSFLIPSISQEPDFDGLEKLKAGPKDWIKADEFMKTTSGEDDKVFAGGDVLDLGLVTIAMYQGRRAAETIHARFCGLPIVKDEKPPLIKEDKILLDYFELKPRQEYALLPVEERLQGDGSREIARTLTEEEALSEAVRCLSCGMCSECGQCWTYCQDQAIIKPLRPGEKYTFKMEFCKGCKKCAEVCPCGYIQMK